jgi:hypothetical protein
MSGISSALAISTLGDEQRALNMLGIAFVLGVVAVFSGGEG